MIYLPLLFAVFVGTLLSSLLRKKSKWNEYLLIFSGAYLLALTLLHSLPELYENTTKSVWLFIVLGLVIQMFLESFSKGVEHGHIHKHEKLTPALGIGLILHALLEGMAIQEEGHNEMLVAIVIHKIPVAAILYYYLRSTFIKTRNAYLGILLFALATPLGIALRNHTFLQHYTYIMLAIVSGLFLHISTTILFERSYKDHKVSYVKLAMIGLATILVWYT